MSAAQKFEGNFPAQAGLERQHRRKTAPVYRDQMRNFP